MKKNDFLKLRTDLNMNTRKKKLNEKKKKSKETRIQEK